MAMGPRFLLSALTNLDLRHSTTVGTRAWRRTGPKVSDDSSLRYKSGHDAVIVSARKRRW